MRKEGSPEFERAIKNLKQLCETTSHLKEDVKQSLYDPIDLLSSVTERLELKGKKFQIFQSADDDEITDFWEILKFIDSALLRSDNSKKILSSRPQLLEFMDHCCQSRHYTFCIKKCGNQECSICLPLKMDSSVFQDLKFLPDPMLQPNSHYLPFDQALSKQTTERDWPSLQKTKNK